MSKKMILIAILLCTLIPFAAQATITRVIGLGGEGANYIVKDAFNPSIWPQLDPGLPESGRRRILHPGRAADFQKAYINYSFGDDNGVLQFSLDRYPASAPSSGCRRDRLGWTYTYQAIPDVDRRSDNAEKPASSAPSMAAASAI